MTLRTLLASFALALALTETAVAQTDVALNDTCQTAEPVGRPRNVDGNLTAGDIDFFLFLADPGDQITVDHQGRSDPASPILNPLGDPLLGLFDSSCNLLAQNDDFIGLNSRLVFTVPSDGVFILAATGFPDFGFTGSSGQSGSYRLAFMLPPASIGSVTGRVVDAVRGDPLSGALDPFPFVVLLRCDTDDCSQRAFVNTAIPDTTGRFTFDRDAIGQPLPVGTYQVMVTANEFESFTTAPLQIGEDETVDLGNVGLIPPSFRFSRIEPCRAIVPQGGTCAYSVQLDNNTATRVTGAAFSIVDGIGIGGPLGFTTFEASTGSGDRVARRQAVRVDAFGTERLEFQFDVPSFAPDGALFCTRVFFGFEPDPLVNVARQGFLFCMAKGESGFERMNDVDSQRMFQMLGGPSRSLGELPPKQMMNR